MAKKTTRPNLVIIPPVMNIGRKEKMMRDVNKNVKTGRKVLILDVNDDNDDYYTKKVVSKKHNDKRVLLTRKTKKSKKK